MNVLLRPIITEKSIQLTALGKFTFEVDPRTSATEVARAITAHYKVKVTDVVVMTVRGHARRTKRGMGRTKNWKKAIITLKKGDMIAGFAIDTTDHADHDTKDKSNSVKTKAVTKSTEAVAQEAKE